MGIEFIFLSIILVSLVMLTKSIVSIGETIDDLKELANKKTTKELTTEQKAQRYDEALQRTRKWYDSNTNEGFRGIFEDIFHELKDSKENLGAEIKKALIIYHSSTGSTHILDKFTSKQICDWLERQGEQNLTVTDEELAQAKEDAYNDALGKIEYHSGEPTFDDGWSAAIWYLKKRIEKAEKDWSPLINNGNNIEVDQNRYRK
jgi:hypothetical protein